jgi:glutathione S-transferase
LEDNSIPYEDVPLNKDSWLELKPKTTFGQVPMIIFEDGTELVQTNAILRALARKYGLYGSSEKEANMIDMINDGQEDERLRYLRMIYQNYEDGKATYIEELATRLKPFEKLLENNGQTFFVGSKVSFVDYSMFDFLDAQLILSPECLDAFPRLKAFHQTMADRPNLAKYRQSEKFSSRKVNGNGKQ